MIIKNPKFIGNKNLKDNIHYFSYNSRDSDLYSKPDTDHIIISLMNQNTDIINAQLIFKMIDDITEYITGELGLNVLDDMMIIYDDTKANVDRFENYF